MENILGICMYDKITSHLCKHLVSLCEMLSDSDFEVTTTSSLIMHLSPTNLALYLMSDASIIKGKHIFVILSSLPKISKHHFSILLFPDLLQNTAWYITRTTMY